ncbi:MULTISPECIES: DUF2498 family protein [Xenorhabdus]|uniref:Uncharacterized protein DUF2498 n=1 Tax=Xenorhabdus ehlersii TaxID=290111 RepID=A0A2D0IQZ9_9GAMM|nr:MULTISPECIES: DUF2498 family protein [Xenorhabdus]MBC8950779.1 hypothetical protein [Xenorhabdus sp. TS4]PHM24214.1 hypothetical protein Xehl_02264 [Xenorhabdus ehlersii]RKE91132.1 uncharacterized protein DUF2498 [Xenorhabdus ehlersii]
MKTKTMPVKRKQLLKKVNEIIKKHEDFIQGMYAESAEQRERSIIPDWLINYQ